MNHHLLAIPVRQFRLQRHTYLLVCRSRFSRQSALKVRQEWFINPSLFRRMLSLARGGVVRGEVVVNLLSDLWMTTSRETL
ncbi:MAG TPA: hypothetical protein VK673_01700 [Chthoniobacterales bacterium]|nr:hypothetical protein [Chthoniobacterales bacterium]